MEINRIVKTGKELTKEDIILCCAVRIITGLE